MVVRSMSQPVNKPADASDHCANRVDDGQDYHDGEPCTLAHNSTPHLGHIQHVRRIPRLLFAFLAKCHGVFLIVLVNDNPTVLRH